MELLAHQKEGLEFLSTRERAALHFTMRLGKTRTTLEHLKSLGAAALPAIIVCPLSAVSVWPHEIAKHRLELSAAAIVGTLAERKKILKAGADVYVINFDGVRIAGLAQFIIDTIKPKTIIMDESHRLKNSATAQWKACKLIAEQARFAFQLTGTPIAKMPTDIWSQFEILKPGFFPNVYAFEHEYCKFRQISVPFRGGGRRFVRQYAGTRHAEQLSSRISELALRKTAEECLNLPATVRQVVNCEMTPEQKKHYHAISTTLTTYLEDHEDAEGEDRQILIDYAAGMVLKLRQVVQGFLYTEDGNGPEAKRLVHRMPSGKLSMLMDLLEDLPKAVIFTDFIEDRARVADEIRKSGSHVPLVFEGNDRDAIKKRFDDPAEKSVLIGSLASLCEGIDLSVCDHFIYFGNTYSHVVRVQSEARGLNATKKRPVTLYDLVCPNTVDESVMSILSLKSETAGKITGDKIRFAKMIANNKFKFDNSIAIE